MIPSTAEIFVKSVYPTARCTFKMRYMHGEYNIRTSPDMRYFDDDGEFLGSSMLSSLNAWKDAEDRINSKILAKLES